MVAAIIAGRIIIHCDGAVALIGIRGPDAEGQEESQENQFSHASPRSFERLDRRQSRRLALFSTK
jgi:hypothetical protein